MILRKPYAFFIKHFKLIHVVMSLVGAYLIYSTNLILNFFLNYISSNASVVGQDLIGGLFNKSLYGLPILMIIISLALLIVLIYKKKPSLFYIINIIIYLFVLVSYFYVFNILEKMETIVVGAKIVRLSRDFLIFSISFQAISTAILLIRGIGFNIKKFDFTSDISGLALDESDREEIELDFNFDFNERRRKRKKRLRYLKYTYKENKIFIHIMLAFFVLVLAFLIVRKFSFYNKINNQNEYFNVSNFNFGVLESYVINKDYKGNLISEDNSLVVIKLRIYSNIEKVKLPIDNFVLNIDMNNYKIIHDYDDKIIDIGEIYKKQYLTNEYKEYLIVYFVPNNMLSKKIILKYKEGSREVKIKLKQTKYNDKVYENNLKMGEELDFKESNIGNIKLKINSFDIKKNYKLDYNFCIKNECIKSVEYLTPTLNTNFDKSIIRISLNYEDNNVLNFYDLFTTYGFIKYKIGDKTYKQTTDFNQISSSKVKENNVYYIEVNEAIENASEIYLTFNVRNYIYNYKLR